MNPQYAIELSKALKLLSDAEYELAQSDYNLALCEAEAVLVVNEDNRYKNEGSRKAAVVLFLDGHSQYRHELEVNRNLRKGIATCKADIEYYRALLRLQVASMKGE